MAMTPIDYRNRFLSAAKTRGERLAVLEERRKFHLEQARLANAELIKEQNKPLGQLDDDSRID